MDNAVICDYNIAMSFEAENEEKRNRNKRGNVVKWYGANCTDEVFYVGDSELIDPYSGNPIYLPSEKQLKEIEDREREAREQIQQMQNAQADDPLLSESMYYDGDSSAYGGDDIAASDDPDIIAANEIYARLMAEAAADEAAKQAEIAALIQEQEADADAYNAETGSYSGLYGKKPMSQSESDELDRIMNQNKSYSFDIESIIADNQNK